MPKPLTTKTIDGTTRIIPATMVSQHPDHAQKPSWHDSPYIRVQDEIFEVHYSFFELGASEYKWDWEGKFVDEAVIERLLSTYYDDFSRNPIGKDKFLTFRLPNPKVETEFRLGRAFMGITAATGLADAAGLTPPLFEVILPMTETSKEMIDVQEAYQEVAALKHPLLKVNTVNKIQQLEVIPLFEQVEVIMDADTILQEYLDYYRQRFKNHPAYIRPYVARSDPALNAGLVPTVLSIKIALSRFAQLADKTDIPMYPIIGSASLPFRGGLTPHSVERFTSEYAGIKTALIQSAFRYDYPIEDVKKAINKIEEILPETSARSISKSEEALLRSIIPHFAEAYRSVIPGIADHINTIAGNLPKRRERVQHVGLFGYSRGDGDVKLPRAIGFTASLYSLGAPPEIIGTGRGLQRAQHALKKQDVLAKVQTHFTGFIPELQRAARFVNRDVVEELARANPAWKEVEEDIMLIEKLTGVSCQPHTPEEQRHHALTGKIYYDLKNNSLSTDLIEEAAVLRKSMG